MITIDHAVFLRPTARIDRTFVDVAAKYISSCTARRLVSRQSRLKLIQAIETAREKKLVAIVTTTRPNILTQLEPTDVRVLRDHIAGAGKGGSIDIFLLTLGGVSTVPWAMASLIREYDREFAVLIPYAAFSAGTSLALGANEIVMGTLGTLSPVDPSVWNEFNPEIQGRPIPISVEDIGGYVALLRDKFELKDERNLAALLDRLPADVRPLALGNAYRHYVKSRDDTRKLLELHMDSKRDESKITKIVETLVEKLYFHGHNLTRLEARQLGLNVKEAESILCNDRKSLNDLLWDLYIEYERDMKLMAPYRDEPPTSGGKTELLAKVIESDAAMSEFVIEQEWVRIPAPAGSVFTQVNNVPALLTPQGQVFPLMFQGSPVLVGGNVFDKREISFWKGY